MRETEQKENTFIHTAYLALNNNNKKKNQNQEQSLTHKGM